jgi:hemerythrin
MPLFEWNDALYSVGVKAIDDQHKKLVEMLNELHEAQGRGQSAGVMNQVLSDLIAYADYHFTTEEDFMRNYEYPDYLKHKAKHDALRQTALGLQADFRSGKRAVSIELSHFLRDWLAHHIQGTDKQLGVFLNSRGVF